MVKVIGLGFIGIIFIVAVLAFMPTSEISGVTIDFQNYYGDAGLSGIKQAQALLVDDYMLSSLISWSIFHDVDVSTSHSSIRHADDQEIYKKCMGDGNVMMGFVNPRTNHCVEVFETTVEEGGRSVKKWLVRIIGQTKEKFYEITAFSDDWEALWEVEEYLIDGGYMQIWP